MPNLLPDNLDTAIIRLTKALYDAAPGYTYLTALRGYGTEAALSVALNANFASDTNAQWAARISTNLHLTGNAAVQGQAYLIASLNNPGATRATVLSNAMKGLAGLENDGQFGAAAQYFNASNLTSYQYSINPANTSTDLAGVLRLADEPNTAPVAVADTASATEGGASIAGTVAANDSDAEGNALTYSLAATQAPVPGLTLNASGGYTFDPTNSAYDSIRAGQTQAVVVNYRVSDGQLSANGTLTITVTGTNDAPTASAVSATGSEDAAKIEVTPNVTDPDVGDTFTYAVTGAPTNGTVSYNSATGKFDYVPAANFFGSDSFVYRVTDGSGASSSAIANVFVASVNDAPTAFNAVASGNEDTAIGGTVTGSDTEGSALSFAVVTSPTRGSVVLNTNGSFVYTPNANFNGTDTFTFQASDGLAASAPKTVTITVAAVNDAPVASNVSANGVEDAASIAVTPQSSDVDTGDTATYSVVTGAGGTP